MNFSSVLNALTVLRPFRVELRCWIIGDLPSGKYNFMYQKIHFS